MTVRIGVCDNCHEHQVMHEGWHDGVRYGLCCGCHVLSGRPAADWHSVCMATYRGETTPLNKYARTNQPAAEEN